MKSRAEKLLAAATGPVVERIVIKPRGERCLPIPARYAEGLTGEWIAAMTGGGSQLWRHQALALERISAGHNLAIATGTASGKSLVFMTPIIHELLTANGKAIVFYPQKALGGDQLSRFRAALTKAGLDTNLVGELNGDVASADRDEVLARCRVILATPDVIHAWLMRQVQSVRIRQFLAELRLVVVDEAHVLEGVFGSTTAYLLRRLRSAHVEADPYGKGAAVDRGNSDYSPASTTSPAADWMSLRGSNRGGKWSAVPWADTGACERTREWCGGRANTC